MSNKIHPFPQNFLLFLLQNIFLLLKFYLETGARNWRKEYKYSNFALFVL